ncbi:winged helix-turn-helix domain-containing protein [Pseudoalteromonas citrea]|nr:winged helix-turn-helix domain-containing protein [Pseudoalteromonas citrea]
MEHNPKYQLGAWRICSNSNSLISQSGTRQLDNKSMQLLLLLIQNAGKTVTKEQILAHLWKGKCVTNDILSVTVSKIRKALDDNARHPIFIKTQPNEGYILIAPVKEIKNTASHHISKTRLLTLLVVCSLLFGTFITGYFAQPVEESITAKLNIDSVAVLPFDDLSPNQNNQYFADGLSDAIINQLSQIKSLKVISRYSSFTYREKYNATAIGDALQVEALLDGSVQRLNEQTRITVRVISTQNGQLLWSNTFDSNNQNHFQLQDTISQVIHTLIHPKTNKAALQSQTINAQAYEWYLMGQYHWRQRTPHALNKAVDYFKHSLELEPDYAPAHIGLAISYAFLHTFGSWGELDAIEAALPHINTALALNPNSPLALATQGMILSDKAKAMKDSTLYHQAEALFTRSLNLESNATTHLWYSILLTRLGKQQQAIDHLRQAITLNPLSASLKRSFSHLLKSMGQLDAAQKVYQQALDLEGNTTMHPFQSAKVNRYTQASILAMADWHADNTVLFTNCSSIEVCEQQVLAYLSVGANKAAEQLLDKMRPIHGHFVYSMNLIRLSEQGNDEQVLSNIKQRIARIPYTQEAHLELANAQFRAARFSSAKNALLKLHPQWRNKSTLAHIEITADNYPAAILLAASALYLNDKKNAEMLLNKVHIFLQQGHVFDNIQTQFSLARVASMLGNTQQALHYLSSALGMGWIESFNMQWWTLQNDHLLKPLQDMPEFRVLLTKYNKKRQTLRETIRVKVSK